MNITKNKCDSQEKKVIFAEKRVAQLLRSEKTQVNRAFNLGKSLARNGKFQIIEDFFTGFGTEIISDDIQYAIDSFVKDILRKRDYAVNVFNELFDSLRSYERKKFIKEFENSADSEEIIRKFCKYYKQVPFSYGKLKIIERELTIYRKQLMYITFDHKRKQFEHSSNKHLEMRTMLKWFIADFTNAIKVYRKRHRAATDKKWIKTKELISTLRNNASEFLHDCRDKLCKPKVAIMAVDKLCISMCKSMLIMGSQVKSQLYIYTSSIYRKNSKNYACSQANYYNLYYYFGKF